MRKVELYPGITSSALGFGCAPIMGSVDGATAKRALAVALEEGITHFDVARCYGFGQAERLLGECVRQRRQEVVIASKFGIAATAAATALRVFKPMVRLLKKSRSQKSPHSDKASGPAQNKLPLFSGNILLKRVPLQPAAMKLSVEKSLRELKTDYLDYFFLHEPLEPVVEIDGLFEAARQLKQAGKIRAFGLAFMQKQAGLHLKYLSQFDVLQMDNSPLRPDYSNLVAQRQALPNIFFSPFRSAVISPEIKRANSSEILRQMQTDFPQSVILVSMFREAHIRENARDLR
jgi:aryl-alcohol dehydrogenase-like predicted oxidoreductase